MNRAMLPLCTTLLLLGACGNGDVAATTASADADEARLATTAPEVSFTPGAGNASTAKPGGPVQISYRIIGTPIVGSPVAVELSFTSALGPQRIEVSYRVNDATALQFPESQAKHVAMASMAADEPGRQQVTVIPMREGRLYLNVSAHIETENGSLSTVTAIPIQVGSPPREILSNGERITDENGETVISLPARED